MLPMVYMYPLNLLASAGDVSQDQTKHPGLALHLFDDLSQHYYSTGKELGKKTSMVTVQELKKHARTNINLCPAEPGYVLSLQIEQIQISWLLEKLTDLDLH